MRPRRRTVAQPPALLRSTCQTCLTARAPDRAMPATNLATPVTALRAIRPISSACLRVIGDFGIDQDRCCGAGAGGPRLRLGWSAPQRGSAAGGATGCSFGPRPSVRRSHIRISSHTCIIARTGPNLGSGTPMGGVEPGKYRPDDSAERIPRLFCGRRGDVGGADAGQVRDILHEFDAGAVRVGQVDESPR